MSPGAERAAAQTTTAGACPRATICDTLLDVDHADITASLVGCSPQKNDLVLLNGKPQDGVVWTLFGIEPSAIKHVDPVFKTLLTGPPPTTFPTVSFRLRPGYYNGLTLTVGNCSFGPFPLATTGAYGDRHLILVEGRGSLATGLAGVYGSMPLPELQVVLRDGSSQTLIARDEAIPSPFGDRYMFYFDAVKPGRYKLSVYGAGWGKSLSDVVVDKAGDLVYRYIRDSDIGL